MGHQTETPDTSTLPRHTRLLRRGSRYYLRAKVPVDLQSAMGKKEIKWALNTSAPREAERLIKFESAKADSIFEAKRQSLRSAKNGHSSPLNAAQKPLRIMSEEHAQELARTWLVRLEREQKEWWEKQGRTLDTPEMNELLSDLWHEKAAITGEAPDVIHPAHRNDGRWEVGAFLTENGLSLAKESPAYSRLCALFREARLESIRRAVDRMEGKPFQCYDPLFADAFAHSTVKRKETGMTVRELGERFIAEQAKLKRAPKTLFAYGIHARLLCDILGSDTPIHQISRADVEKVCDVLDVMPSNATKRYSSRTVQEAIQAAGASGDKSRLSPNSRRNYFFNMFSVFQYAVKTKATETNPFDDYWFKQRFTPASNGGENEEETVTFTSDELKLVFAAPLFTGCKDDENGYAKPGPHIVRRGRFWVPLIALFHGLRLNEICQLYTQDVKRMEGELVLEVRASLDKGQAAPDKRTKNKASIRTVPIHPELLKMGFEEYVKERRRDSASPRLFPELRSAKKSGSYSDVFSKWFARFLKNALGRKSDATFHSFRHNWRDALREADVSPERVNELGGWAHAGQHAKYGRAKLVQTLKAEISKVRYPFLDFSPLYTE